MEAKAKGLDNVQILRVPHPLGAGQRPEMVKQKALNSMETLEKLMTGKL